MPQTLKSLLCHTVILHLGLPELPLECETINKYIIIRGVVTPNGYFVSKQEDDVAGGAAFGSWVDMMIELAGECH